MINHAEKVDCGAIVREKFWHHFWQNTFSAESIREWRLNCQPAGNREFGVRAVFHSASLGLRQ